MGSVLTNTEYFNSGMNVQQIIRAICFVVCEYVTMIFALICLVHVTDKNVTFCLAKWACTF